MVQMAAFMWGPQEDINNKPLYFRHRLLDTINHIIDVCIVTRVESFEGRNQISIIPQFKVSRSKTQHQIKKKKRQVFSLLTFHQAGCYVSWSRWQPRV